MITKPLLAAAAEDLNELKYPVLATPKLDGIRCLVINGQAVSRKLKPIPNNYIRARIEKSCPNGFDGEIIIPGKDFNDVQSLVMSVEGEPHFEYHVFDYVIDSLEAGYDERIRTLITWAKNTIVADAPFVKLVLPQVIENIEALQEYEAKTVDAGFEGVMLRKVDGRYKCGRSTLKEALLLKVKRWSDVEAVVIGFEELMTNTNEQVRNELGLAKRSTHKEGMVPAGTLGALKVKDASTGVEFSIGSGLDDAIRAKVWANRDDYVGKLVTYKCQPSGAKDKPRFPIFKGFRHKDDV